MQSKGGSLALGSRMPVGNRWLRDPSPPRGPSPSSETFVEVVETVHLSVGSRVDAHFKRCPDPILKALKRKSSNLTIKDKQ